MNLAPLRIVLLAAVLAALALASSTVAGARTGGTGATVRDANAIEAPLLGRINAARKARGLAPLRFSAALARAAEGHARSMGRRGFFGHSSADGTSPAARIRRYYSGSTVGETLLWRSPGLTAGEALRMWLQSPSHRAILLDRTFRHVGLAAVHADEAGGSFGGRPATIVVADFGAP